ncbi:MAG: hypothetical protein GY929_21975 [Actinomycetia bacterium]|nr:hypothetical protein [Actinomycetes bacterium]
MRPSRGGEGGHAALELVLVVGLLLVPATILLAAVPVWVERQDAARDAAAVAARAAVAEGDVAVVATAVADVESAWGLAPSALVWSAQGDPGGRGGSFTVAVTVELPAIDLPVLGSFGAVEWTTSHTERVPAHRSRT